jgi:methionyl-tRNA synthetase
MSVTVYLQVMADGSQYLLQEKGLIYEAKHEGWYSVTDEAFYPESAVQPYLDPPTGRKIMVYKAVRQ